MTNAIRVSASGAPQPSGPYSQGVIAGDLLFCAGQGPFDATGARVGDSFEEQVRITLGNLNAVCQAAGTSLQHAVRVGAYLSSMNLFERFNAEYASYFPDGAVLPARTTVAVDLRGFDVEIDAVVLVSDGAGK